MSDSSIPFHIAIDGPVAAGKGTVAKQVAQKLGYLYIDTGAMYRTVALIGLTSNISLDNESELASRVKQVDIQMRNPNQAEQDGRQTTVMLDGKDISWDIRTEAVGAGASQVATYPLVRQVLVQKQQEIAKGQNVVMEGRDITYRVLPDAQLKIFLTASPEERARRRQKQLADRGIESQYEQVYRDLIKRDEQDMTRSVDPLQIVEDAVVIDTSALDIDQVVEEIIARV